MIAIGNGEACPFCKGEDKFINDVDKDFMSHCLQEHKDEFTNALFGGGKDRVISKEDEKPTYTCAICGEESSVGYYNYYAGDTEENILCENGDCWSEWNCDQMQEVSDE